MIDFRIQFIFQFPKKFSDFKREFHDFPVFPEEWVPCVTLNSWNYVNEIKTSVSSANYNLIEFEIFIIGHINALIIYEFINETFSKEWNTIYSKITLTGLCEHLKNLNVHKT